jgi:ribosomal protein S28E/S33
VRRLQQPLALSPRERLGSHVLLHLPRSTSWQETEKMPENLWFGNHARIFRILQTHGAAGKVITVQLHPADINQARRGLKRNKKAAVAEGKQGDLVKTSAKSDVTAPLPSPICGYIAQVEVFEHIPPITTGQYRIAITARSLARRFLVPLHL